MSLHSTSQTTPRRSSVRRLQLGRSRVAGLCLERRKAATAKGLAERRPSESFSIARLEADTPRLPSWLVQHLPIAAHLQLHELIGAIRGGETGRGLAWPERAKLWCCSCGVRRCIVVD